MELKSAVCWTKVEAAADVWAGKMQEHNFIKFATVQVDFAEF